MRSIRKSLLAGVVIMPWVMGSAFAQAVPAGSAEPAEEPEAIVVTGTRLQSGFSAPTPVTVVGEQLLERRAVTTVADALNDLPTFRASSSPGQNQRGLGGGQNNVDLRGLGAIRTLVLMDGERLTPTLANGTSDLNLVPSGLIERIDVVTGGASAAYGSDAVAGVVNVILKRDFEGLQGALQYGISEQGDAEERLASLAFGHRFADGKGQLLLGGEYADNSGIGTIATREWGRLLPGLVAYGASRPAGTPSQGFETGVTYSAQSADGVVTSGPLRGLSFRPNGQTYQFDYGQVLSSLMIGGSNPGGSPFGNWPLLIPTKRGTALGRLTYELAPELTIKAQLEYGVTIGTGFTSYNQSTFTIDRNNAFLPATVRSQMVAQNLQTIQVGKLLTELGGLRQYNRHENVRGVLGLSGGLGDWNWDAAYTYGVTNNYEAILDNTLTANYSAAVAAVTDGSGQIVCAPLTSNPNVPAARRAQVLPGCVPINIFGAGAPSPDALAYISETSYQDVRLTRSTGAINLRGSPFSTGAGPVNLAMGAEFRRDTLRNVADPLGERKLFNSGNRTSYTGAVSVYEGYAELGVPVLRDVPGASSLDVNGAVRATHYSTSGWVTTWKLGLTYEPIEALRLRVARSRDIRAPNLRELFLAGETGVFLSSTVNPINGRTGALITDAIGNPNLTPEIANTFTAGMIFQPQGFARGLRISVDYFDIKIKDVITTVSGLEILRRCNDGVTASCSAITFDNSSFGVESVRTAPANLSQLRTNGLDVELAYGFNLRDAGLPIAGRFDIRALGTKVWHRTTTDDAGSIDRAGSAQNGGVPDWTWNFDFVYTTDRFTGSLGFRYTSPIRYDSTLFGPDSPSYSPSERTSINDNTFPSSLYMSISAQYDLISSEKRKLQLFGVVNNALNKQPPVFAAIGINQGGNPFDLIGRRYRVGLRFRY